MTASVMTWLTGWTIRGCSKMSTVIDGLDLTIWADKEADVAASMGYKGEKNPVTVEFQQGDISICLNLTYNQAGDLMRDLVQMFPADARELLEVS